MPRKRFGSIDQDRTNVTSRRTFLLAGGLAAGGLACTSSSGHASMFGSGTVSEAALTPAFQDEAPSPHFDFAGVTMPIRRSFYDYTGSDLQLLVTAYGAIKKLPTSDPRAWLNQANIHAAHCGGDLLEVHGGWWFTVWHRCYIFFYERILARLSGDPQSFALPYWDWANHQVVPNTRLLEQEGQPSPFFDQASPLFDQLRNPTQKSTFSNDSNMSQAAQYCDPVYIRDSLLKETDFNNFCGYPDAGGPGDLEQFPHNNVHIWVGDNVGHQGQDMDDLTTAAKDLLFFLHHANVDRLFTLWQKDNAASLPPKESPWYAQSFNFYDEKGTAVSVTVQDAIDHMAGKYQAPQQEIVIAAQPQELVLGGPSKTLESLPVPENLKRMLAVAPVPPSRRPVRLEFQGVEAPHDTLVVLHVFINKKDATTKDVGGPDYAGTLTILPSSKAHAKKQAPFTLSLDVGQKFGALLEKSKNISVTIVPEPGIKKPAEHAERVRFQRLSVRVGH
jgi:polyphenol oxidase